MVLSATVSQIITFVFFLQSQTYTLLLQDLQHISHFWQRAMSNFGASSVEASEVVLSVLAGMPKGYDLARSTSPTAT